MWDKIKKAFIQRNYVFIRRPRLFIWLTICFLITWNDMGGKLPGFIFTFVLYVVLIQVALSNILEKLIRKLEDARHVATSSEKERLLDLFEEVYDRVKENNSKISKKIKLYIVDSAKINACAIGRNTIIINRGLMNAMTDDEVKGILAHEFAHIVNADTQVTLLIQVATTVYLWGILAVNFVVKFIKELNNAEGAAYSLLDFISTVLEIGISILVLFWNLIIAGNQRKREYKADQYAYELGYGEELLSALNKFYQMEILDKKNLLQRAQIGHPKSALRIEQIELMIEREYEVDQEEQAYLE